MTTSYETSTQFLQRPEGRIAYDVTGEGPLVICAPGMGDVRQVYRFLVPRLVEAGYRVADHGPARPRRVRHDVHRVRRVPTGEDALALAEHLLAPGGKAVLVANSMSAGSSVWAAVERPDLVAGLALIGPFVRDGDAPRPARLLLALALRRPWGASAWKSYLTSLYPGAKPADLPRAPRARHLEHAPPRWLARLQGHPGHQAGRGRASGSPRSPSRPWS